MARLLIIDDDPKICLFLTQLIESIGHHVNSVYSKKDGIDQAINEPYDLILLDLEFPDGNGLDILPDLLGAPSLPEVIIITGTGDVKGAETAFKFGAWDYVQKPFIWDEVSLPITRALQYRGEKEKARSTIALNRIGIIGESKAIRNCLEDMARAISVLITGETGTGKELFARAIHENSKRSSNNFVAIDCGALPATLAESTLFGHEKGAYTGADKRREGLVLQAAGGTLFLDEIGDLPLSIQKSLLRLIQERRVRPVGSKEEVSVDFRLVSATNRNLKQMVKNENFREDLLFRICAMEIKLPPLRLRKNDIHEITIRKILQLGQRYGIDPRGISPEFLDVLNTNKWPGNVRELMNVLEYALATAGPDPILFPKHLPPEYRTAYLNIPAKQALQIKPLQIDTSDKNAKFPTMSEYKDKMEKDYLQMLFGNARSDRKEACRLSGISQSRLYGLLKKYNLPRFGTS